MMHVLFQLILAFTLLSCVAGTSALAAEERHGLALLQPGDVSVVVPQSALDQQYEFLVRAGATEVTYGSTGFVSSVTGPLNIVLQNLAALKPGDSAPSVLEALAPVTLTTGTESLKVARNSLNEEAGTRSVVFDQLIRDRPVFLAGLEITVDESSGVVRRFRSRVIPDRGLPAQPKIAAARSVELATAFLEGADWAEKGSVQVEKKPWLGYFAGAAEAQKPTLVWAINLSYVSPDRPPPARPRAPRYIQVYIDATDGQFRGETSMSSHAPKTVYSAQGVAASFGGFPNGTIRLFGEGEPQSDERAINAWNNATKSQNAWSTLFSEDVGPLGLVVRWGPGGNAASNPGNLGLFWMAFADGNSAIIPVGDSLDVVAHEYGHGIFLKHARAVPSANEETANLSEAYADLSSVIVDVRENGIRSATWELEEIYRANPTQGVVSWIAPKTRGTWWVDWYPSKLQGIGADVHYNSTVLGVAYRLTSEGGVHPRAGQGGIPVIQVSGVTHVVAQNIFYRALRDDDGMHAYPNFRTVRRATIAAANTYYGSTVATSVRQGWDAVGVADCENPPKPAPGMTNGTLEDLLCGGRYRINWSPVAGATTYHAQRVRAGYSWSLATDIVDGNVTSCNGQVSTTHRFRMRACNECGCSEYQDLGTVQFWQTCP